MPYLPKQIIKHEGECWNKAMWKYCNYWSARRDPETGRVLEFWCDLYDKAKPSRLSLDECNDEFGQSYRGGMKRG